MSRANLMRFLLLALIWGGSYTFIKVAGEGLSPALLTFLRIALGAVVLGGFAAVRRVRLPRMGFVWVHITIAAILGMVAPFVLLAWGERHTSAAMAGVLAAAFPLITLVAAAALLPGERATGRKTTGFLLGFAGVVLIVAPWEGTEGGLAGNIAVLGAAACYAAQAVYIRRFLSDAGLTPLALAMSQLLAATVVQGAVLPLTPWETPQFTWPVLGSIVILGSAATGIAYVLYFRLINDLGAGSASGVDYLVPVVGMVASTVLLGDRVTWTMIVGGAVVLTGLALAENRLASAPATSPDDRRRTPEKIGS